jgi:TldD protein
MEHKIAHAKDLLLTQSGIELNDLNKILNGMMSHGVDYADLYFQYTKNEYWGLEEGQVKSGSFSIDQGVGVRAVNKDKSAFAYSDDISIEALLSSSNIAKAIASKNLNQNHKLDQPKITSNLYNTQDPLSAVPAETKIKILEKIENFAKKMDERITKVTASIAGEYEVIFVINNEQKIAADIRPLVRLSINVIAESNGKREQGSSGGGGRFGFEYFSDDILKQYAQEAVHQAITNLDAKPAPAGSMTVVLGPGWPGILLHEAIGHGLEGDFNRKGSSAFAGKIGQRVAAKGVTVLDDGTIADRRGSLNVDDEGQATQRNVLIEDGILRGYMQDSMNARLMGVEPTGNGRRESYAHVPMPRMTNTYMLSGDKTPEEIVASIDKGLYATNFGGGQVDITSGKFVFSASQAWWVEKGVPLYPVKGATIVGNGPDALTRVSMIANDMRLDSGVGTCGKEGQSVPVGVGQPTLRVDGLTVGGTA